MVILAGFAYIFYRYLGLLGLFSFTGFFVTVRPTTARGPGRRQDYPGGWARN